MRKLIICSILQVVLLFSPKSVFAASGSPGAMGSILYVEGTDGVVGWAQGANSSTISVDIYISRKGEGASRALCSRGNIPTDETLPDVNKRFGNKNGKLFHYIDNCIKNLTDGSYDVHLALGPNLFAPGPFTFTIKTIDTNANIRLWAHYLGVMINRVPNDYDNYPTVMRDGDMFKMWYASGNLTGHPGDNIFYAESNNGIVWNLVNGPLEGGAVLIQTLNDCTCSQNGETSSCPANQSFAVDDMHVADPSVVKLNGVYYMYYTAASKRFACFGSGNNIALATSTDGINWQKNMDSTNAVVPIITMKNPCTSATTCGPWVQGYPSWYGAGMPSVIYKDIDNSGIKKFLIFYTDMSVNGWAWSSAITPDGKNNITVQNSLAGETSWDVKYSNYLSRFISINPIPTDPGVPGTILIGYSNTGQQNTWQNTERSSAAFSMDQFTTDQNHWVVSNGGFLGNPEGSIDSRNTIMYMGAGRGMQPLESTWDIVGIDLWFSKPSTTSLQGDLNGDGKVDIFDYNLLVSDFGKAGSPAFSPADLDTNGKVDIFDYNILVGNFGKTQ